MSKQRNALTIKHEQQQRTNGRIMAVAAHSQRPDLTRLSKADMRQLGREAVRELGELGRKLCPRGPAQATSTPKPPKGGFHWINSGE